MKRMPMTGLAAVAVCLSASMAGFAQDVVTTPEAADAVPLTPSITVNDQVILNDHARIASVTSSGPGFVVIHVDADGAPGPVAGYRAVGNGTTVNLDVPFDPAMATPVMYAMLHTDDGTVGTYEFNGSSGVDNPVAVDGAVITPAFNASMIALSDQPASDAITVDYVVMSAPGWVVIHSDNNGAPGPVLGQTLVGAGNTAAVSVPLSPEGRTDVVWPMLHLDDGTIGTYEFDGASGLDNPVTSPDGVVAVAPLWTVPHMRMSDQIATYGDNSPVPQDRLTPSVIVDSVVSDGPGLIAMHTDSNGQPGPVAGWAFVPAGVSHNVQVVLSEAAITPVLWPMLHVDDGTVGTYEFDGSSGLDNPVSVDGNVVTFPVNAAPSMTLVDQMGGAGLILVNAALMDAPGWLVIHSSADGAPGPVLGQVALVPGVNSDVLVQVDAAAAGTQVFPMLHYDTGAAGVYEFGSVEGADLPVVVGGNVVVAPLVIGQ